MGDIIFNRFFISVGNVFISLISFFKNFSLNNTKEDSEERPLIFNSLEMGIGEDNDKILEFRENIIGYLFNRTVLLGLTCVVIVLDVIFGLEPAAIFLIVIVMGYIYIICYPKIKIQKRYDDLNQELPYALRHIGIELKSGKGLHDALLTIRNSDYGSLSDEFKRVLEEINYGKSSEDALLEMSRRVNSDGLSRAIKQIIGTLRVGGNLATNLEIIADDISFDMHIKLKEYSQKLNSFILIYTFLAILLPVISLIMLMAATTVMGDLISSNMLIMIYSLFFPLVVVFMAIFIKRLEPKI